MKAGTKYTFLLLALIVALFLSAEFETTLKSAAKWIFASRPIANGLTVIAFSVSFIHRIRYSRNKFRHLTFEQFHRFGGELLALFATPVTLVGSWSLLRGYVLQHSHDIRYFSNFSEVDLTFICLVSGFFFISSMMAVWRQFKEIRMDVSSIRPLPKQEPAKEKASDDKDISEITIRR